jgi:hypothetical protein
MLMLCHVLNRSVKRPPTNAGHATGRQSGGAFGRSCAPQSCAGDGHARPKSSTVSGLRTLPLPSDLSTWFSSVTPPLKTPGGGLLVRFLNLFNSGLYPYMNKVVRQDVHARPRARRESDAEWSRRERTPPHDAVCVPLRCVPCSRARQQVRRASDGFAPPARQTSWISSCGTTTTGRADGTRRALTRQF